MDKGSFNKLINTLIFRNCEYLVFFSNKISIKNDNELAGNKQTWEEESGKREKRERRKPGMSGKRAQRYG